MILRIQLQVKQELLKIKAMDGLWEWFQTWLLAFGLVEMIEPLILDLSPMGKEPQWHCLFGDCICKNAMPIKIWMSPQETFQNLKMFLLKRIVTNGLKPTLLTRKKSRMSLVFKM